MIPTTTYEKIHTARSKTFQWIYCRGIVYVRHHQNHKREVEVVGVLEFVLVNARGFGNLKDTLGYPTHHGLENDDDADCHSETVGVDRRQQVIGTHLQILKHSLYSNYVAIMMWNNHVRKVCLSLRKWHSKECWEDCR